MLLIIPLVVLLGIALGVARSRARLRTHDTFTLASAHRHLAELPVLAPIAIAATLALILLLRSPRFAWYLPPELDLWSGIILWLLSGGVFAYLAGIGVHVAFVRRDPERGKLVFACVVILGALGFLQVRGEWPVAGHLGHQQTPEGYVLQTSAYSCCAASLANVARHWGVPATEPQMARLAGTTCAGTSVGQAMHALQQIGLRGRKRTATIEELRRIQNPCILLVEYPGHGPDSHAVALLPSTNSTFRIIDPLAGPESWSADHLRRVWRGHAIECRRDGRD